MFKSLFIVLTITLSAISYASSVAIKNSAQFVSGTNSQYPYVLTATTSADGSTSRDSQEVTINVVSLPIGGADWRVYRTNAKGLSYNTELGELTTGSNTFTVDAVSFNRTVKFQFSSGDVEFNLLQVNGEQVYPGAINSNRSALVENSYLFATGPNSTWSDVITLTTNEDGAASQSAQTLEIDITALPAGGANYRVYKTTANGDDFFGDPTPLGVGTKTITVNSVGFNRVVKIQFNSGQVAFNALSVNGTTKYPGAPLITLVNGNSVDSELGAPFADPGSSAIDDIGTDLSSSISVSGTVDVNTLGDYTLTYSVTDANGTSSSVDRVVTVVESDIIAPVVSINGSENLEVNQTLDGEASSFNDEGVTATDNIDDNSSLQIEAKVRNSDGDVLDIAYLGNNDAKAEIDTTILGVYTVTYTITDAAGNEAVAVRTVTVVELDSDNDTVVDSLDVHPGFNDAELTTYLSNNGYVTRSSLLDARVGSTLGDVSNGTATITLKVERSDDGMTTWSTPEEGTTSVDIPVSGDSTFFRVRAQ